VAHRHRRVQPGQRQPQVGHREQRPLLADRERRGRAAAGPGVAGGAAVERVEEVDEVPPLAPVRPHRLGLVLLAGGEVGPAGCGADVAAAGHDRHPAAGQAQVPGQSRQQLGGAGVFGLAAGRGDAADDDEVGPDVLVRGQPVEVVAQRGAERRARRGMPGDQVRQVQQGDRRPARRRARRHPGPARLGDGRDGGDGARLGAGAGAGDRGRACGRAGVRRVAAGVGAVPSGGQRVEHPRPRRGLVQADQVDVAERGQQGRQPAALDEQRDEEPRPGAPHVQGRLPLLGHPGPGVAVAGRQDRHHPVRAGERGVDAGDEVRPDRERVPVELDLVTGPAELPVDPFAPGRVRAGDAEEDPERTAGVRRIAACAGVLVHRFDRARAAGRPCGD
jgi:hypothetical protein